MNQLLFGFHEKPLKRVILIIRTFEDDFRGELSLDLLVHCAKHILKAWKYL